MMTQDQARMVRAAEGIEKELQRMNRTLIDIGKVLVSMSQERDDMRKEDS
jgi:hypothetical protein